MKIDKMIWDELSRQAWVARNNARILGDTKVGASIYYDQGRYISGCNVEHKFRCHDIHAEVNAIGSMVAQGGKKVIAILIVAERDKFTPCGSCMDWIFEFGDPGTLIAFQPSLNAEIQVFSAHDLMPHYPR